MSDEAAYRVKWIRRHGEDTPICMQNKNGPCPLLAITNALLLRGNISLSPGTAEVGHEHLEMLLTEYLYRANEDISKGKDIDVAVNSQMNLADAVALLPRLRTGIDVNVRFLAPDAFEFTRELACFDLFRLRLLHGWLIDPENSPLLTAIGDLSFNQAMDLLVAAQVEEGDVSQGEDPQAKLELASRIQMFLEEHPSQLTEHGLSYLTTEIRDGEYCILFRNNHFSTVTQHDHQLYILVSDIGFLGEVDVVWEMLLTVGGDSVFVNGDFVRYGTPTVATSSIPLAASEGENDEDVARRLQVAEEEAVASSRPRPDTSQDERLARRLQENGVRRAATATSTATRNTSKPRATKTDCIIQ